MYDRVPAMSNKPKKCNVSLPCKYKLHNPVTTMHRPHRGIQGNSGHSLDLGGEEPEEVRGHEKKLKVISEQ